MSFISEIKRHCSTSINIFEENSFAGDFSMMIVGKIFGILLGIFPCFKYFQNILEKVSLTRDYKSPLLFEIQK